MTSHMIISHKKMRGKNAVCACACVQRKLGFVYRVRAFPRDVHACRYIAILH